MHCVAVRCVYGLGMGFGGIRFVSIELVPGYMGSRDWIGPGSRSSFRFGGCATLWGLWFLEAPVSKSAKAGA
jgi:hypothetical protein